MGFLLKDLHVVCSLVGKMIGICVRLSIFCIYMLYEETWGLGDN